MKQCTTNQSSKTTDGAAGSRGKGAPPNTMTAAATSPRKTGTSTVTAASTAPSPSKASSTQDDKGERKTGGKVATASGGPSELKPSKQHPPYPHHYPLHHYHHQQQQQQQQLSAKMNGKLSAGVGDHLSALNLLPPHLRDMFLAAHLLRGYYQPAGPLISPHLLPQPPTSQHGPGLSGLLGKGGPDAGSPLAGPHQPPSSSTADSTDSDVLLTGGDLTPRSSQLQQQQQQQQAAYGASRYGPVAGGPPGNLYGRPMQMHCPPAYLPPNYYAPSPYGQPPTPHPPPPPPEMYYTHAYPAHYYPKFAAPQYYPASRRYYPGPAPGQEHLYEQAPPTGAPVPQPPPPPAGAQLVPAGPPQGPQHLEHYPYPAYPGYGSPGPGSGGQCYSRNLPHPPPFMDAHYTTNCPCPMQCPKNVNAGSLIGIKASKGPVANNNNHIVQSQTSTIMSTEPITISSSSSSASSSSSPALLDIHAPITVTSESGSQQAAQHGYHHQHHHGHHGVPRSASMETHHHPGHQYHHHHSRHQPPPEAPAAVGVSSSTVVPSVTTVTTTQTATPTVVTTASSADHHYHRLHHHHQQQHHPTKLCYKTEQLIKPESSAELLSPPVHYGSAYHHHYHPAMGYYHHPKLADLKEEPVHGGKLENAPMPPYSIAGKIALIEPPEMSVSPARGSTGLSIPPMPGEALQPSVGGLDGEKGIEKASKDTTPNAIVKQEIEEFKLDLTMVGAGTVCKKEDFEETGPAMTPDLLDESIVIKKDRDEEKLTSASGVVDEAYHQQQQQQLHHLQHHLQLGPPPPPPPAPHHHHLQHMQQVASHHPHHHHHSASTNLLHGPPHHHHHVHPHYSLHLAQPQQQHQQLQPLLKEPLTRETDEDDANNLPPDSKSLLTELVLTTEASMEPRGSPALPNAPNVSSKVATSSTTTSTTTDTSQHQPRESSSSDSSLSVSDSLAIPGRTANDDAKVQSRDVRDNAIVDLEDPPSPVTIPASTVKRRPLLVACKKATTKHSPPNSYKNLIKRTNGADEPVELHPVACIEAVELSEEEEEEEEVDEEEEEEDDGDDDDEEEDDEEDGDNGEEDVEEVELEEQRKVLADQRQRGASRSGHKLPSIKRPLKPPIAEGGRRKSTGSVRKLLAATIVTPRDKHRRQSMAQIRVPPPTPRRPRKLVKRIHRVFRTSIESLKRLPPSLRGRLLGRSNVTLVPVRGRVRKRSIRSPETVPSLSSPIPKACDITPPRSQLLDLFDKQIPLMEDCVDTVAAPANLIETESRGRLPQVPIEPCSNSNVAPAREVAAKSSAFSSVHLSNVDRTIDLVAKGYFSEPEILTGYTDSKVNSRAWLKKLKHQQQQEGRSHSEQSRKPAPETERTGDDKSAAKKGKKKVSPLAIAASTASLEDQPSCVATVLVDKKSKSKSKSSKNVPTTEVVSSPPSTECPEPKGKKKSTKKKKQKTPDSDSEDRGSKRTNVQQMISLVPIEETDAMYQRATSTPILPNCGSTLPSGADDVEQPETEEDLPKDSILDESVANLMDHSSVIDDRETDFDDAATVLVEDDVASVDTSVLVHRHNNNNNNSAVTDKNNPSDEQQRTAAGEQLTLALPLQAVIAEGKEGSELEPPEGMEPFLDEEQEAEQENQHQQGQGFMQQMEPLQPSLPPPPVLSYPQEYVARVAAVDQPLYYDDEEMEEDLNPKRGSSRTVKRRRSRSKSKSKKFSTKKRHRPSHRGSTAEVEELIVPRKCNSIPRWSNGWTWEGHPFQGKVFLNSDDPPVLRTCYPAMRHPLGDMIRPRDCVLLRAGTKRAELPYVAKVAHLWENPEDGEMMMSVLWYYRPEHTEQGRQRTDGPDEVFASRHKDHNSVACIEDKCYVLTFSEYCRFRRQLKGLEENIEEQPSIVPALRRENPRLPPSVVAPELVMYCQRVYEFRLKRLLKCTS